MDMPWQFGQLLKSVTAIQEPEPGTVHNLCKLLHFITAEDISDNIFQGGGENCFRGISLYILQFPKGLT